MIVPWWCKLAAKLLLSRAGLPYRAWRALRIFRHGAMREPDYANRVFRRHYDRAKDYLPAGPTVLELGPGDSLATALLAAGSGADRSYLVDAGPYAIRDPEAYRSMAIRLGLPAAFDSMDEMLRQTRCTYLTEGLSSLRSVPAGSVGFVFSHAVLEHIPLAEFSGTVAALHRLQSDGGISSHRVDLRDHLGGSLNSLRFSRRVWESRLFAESGFYTNRLRVSQVVGEFRSAGYELVFRSDDRWTDLPLRRGCLHPDFASMPDEELLVKGTDLIFRKGS